MGESGPELIWDVAPGYDLFTSLYVIHNPGDFGLRASWAAGVRSRLAPEMREMLSEVLVHFGIPAHWVHALPQPRDGQAIVRELEGIEPGEVLPALYTLPGSDDPVEQLYLRIWKTGKWSEDDLEQVQNCCPGMRGKKDRRINRRSLEAWLNWWTNPEEFGRRYKNVIGEYYESFYREEERRISSELQRGYDAARELSQTMETRQFFEELTGGLDPGKFTDLESIVLIPSFWASPMVFYGPLGPGKGIMVFGARPKDAALVPGEPVPDNLSIPLNTLSDHTRLRILKLLREEPLTAGAIAKSLRLRAPTISHHLKSLRIAGLVSLTKSENDEMRYSTRVSRVVELCGAIRQFLEIEE